MFTSDNPTLSISTPADAGVAPALAITPSVQFDCKSTANLARYLEASLAANTRRAYESDVRACIDAGLPVPATPRQLAGYLADHAAQLSPHTLARRVIALSRMHRRLGYPDPCRTELVRATLQGIRRVHGTGQRRVAPLLREQLLAIVATLPGSTKGIRDRALLLVGFAAALRRSELVALQCRDVKAAEDGVGLHLRRSKTDQHGKGRIVWVPRIDSALCPVTALGAWLDLVEIQGGPLFRRLTKSGRVDMQGLSSQSVALLVKEHVGRIGLDARQYAGHSLRAGFITSAARQGISAWQIRQQSGHRSDAVLQIYVRSNSMEEHMTKQVLCG